ncbi:MAG: DUF3883 domain-containing protein [Bacillota bacterium]|nr:DUF3883 domain-containing protein [Bacillota bacterium]
MGNFQNAVKKISSGFLKEAKQSPKLLSDMAKMEYYMAESYSGRVFIELLQNADDAKSTKIYVYQNGENLYFANNGKAFDEDDLVAISRSGASGKERGKTIGYRGVGFKSVSSISEDIVIYSSNTYFTFSKSLCAKVLNMEQKDVPTIRIPVLLEDVPVAVKQDVEMLCRSGFTTVFVFRNAKLDLFIDEIKTIDTGYFLFLNSIQECRIDVSMKDNMTYFVERFNDNENSHIIITTNDSKKEWMIVKEKNISVAFLIEDGVIVPCSEADAVYHCYLPTLDKSIVPCKINADFSTDPSRKHLTIDDKTKDALIQVSEIFVNILSMAIQNAESGKYKNIFTLFLNKSTLSKVNFFLDENLEIGITKMKWLLLNNGEKVSPKDYKLFPYTFELDNPAQVRKIPSALALESLPSIVYDMIDKVDEFISQFSRKEFTLDEIADTLTSRDFVGQLNVETHTQLVTNVVRETKIKSKLNPGAEVSLDKILVKTETQENVSIKDLVSAKKTIDKKMKQELTERLGNSEIQWLQEQTGIQSLSSNKTQDIDNNLGHSSVIWDKRKSIVPHISKWRDAESKCIEIEKILGNEPIDVSVKNLGYDILSTTPDGTKRYIEVKSVKKDFAFSLTNNEYTAAHEYGDDYFVCLLCENENVLEVRYIKNPLVNAKFEKRIRQWEWTCLEFNSTIQSFDIS